MSAPQITHDDVTKHMTPTRFFSVYKSCEFYARSGAQLKLTFSQQVEAPRGARTSASGTCNVPQKFCDKTERSLTFWKCCVLQMTADKRCTVRSPLHTPGPLAAIAWALPELRGLLLPGQKFYRATTLLPVLVVGSSGAGARRSLVVADSLAAGSRQNPVALLPVLLCGSFKLQLAP